MTDTNTQKQITVIKLDADGREQLRYPGRLLTREPDCVRLEATFSLDKADIGWATFRRGDRFVETFYTDRWYNVFAVYDRDGGGFKGWYCNVGRPAVIDDKSVSQEDLALDLWVTPEGETHWLDEDELAALALTAAEQTAVATARAELLHLAHTGTLPR